MMTRAGEHEKPAGDHLKNLPAGITNVVKISEPAIDEPSGVMYEDVAFG